MGRRQWKEEEIYGALRGSGLQVWACLLIPQGHFPMSVWFGSCHHFPCLFFAHTPPRFYHFQEQKPDMASFPKLIPQTTKPQYKDNNIAHDQNSESRCGGVILHHIHNVSGLSEKRYICFICIKGACSIDMISQYNIKLFPNFIESFFHMSYSAYLEYFLQLLDQKYMTSPQKVAW